MRKIEFIAPLISTLLCVIVLLTSLPDWVVVCIICAQLACLAYFGVRIVKARRERKD